MLTPVGPVVLSLLGCFDYVLHEPEVEIRSPLDDTALPRLAAPDPYTACEEFEVELAEDVGIDESCVHEIVTGDLDAIVEWQLTTFGQYPQHTDIVMAPVVGQLTDDNDDGVIDHDDTPDIVVISDDPSGSTGNEQAGALRVIDGATGREHWTVVSTTDADDNQVLPYRYSNVALGDVDMDGQVELVLMAVAMGSPTAPGDSGGGTDTEVLPPESGVENPGDSGGEVPIDPGPPSEESGEGAQECVPVAFDTSGNVVWVAFEAQMTCGGHAPAVGDLEGDGDVEIVVGNVLVDGATGALIAKGDGGQARGSPNPEFGTHTVLSDLDGDGTQEILAGNTLYAPDGSVICKTGGSDGYPAPADLDLDGVGEFALVADGRLILYEADCTEIVRVTLNGGGHGGPPTVADFDSDGAPEIGVAEAQTYTVYEVDGSVKWSQPVTDQSSHTTGSVVFDFEGDGRPEVVYGDEVALWVFSGEDGTVRLQDDLHESRTLHEFPTVVDVDGDGRTEILVPNAGTHYGEVGLGGLYVLGSTTDSWLGNRQVWNQHGYCITNIDDDLGMPSPPRSNWPTHNNFRSGDPNPAGGGMSADAVPIVDVCDAECEVGQILVAVRIGNGGMAGLTNFIPVSAYALDGAARRYLGTKFTSEVIAPGETSKTVRFRFDRADIPETQIEIVVDRAGNGAHVVRECHEDNNAAIVDLPDCG